MKRPPPKPTLFPYTPLFLSQEDSMDKSPTSPPLQSVDQKREADLRGWINWLDTWRVCANTACERARCCRGKASRSEEHTSELQSLTNLVCRLLLEKKKIRRT